MIGLFRPLVLAVFLATPAWGEAARVSGGEHLDFTRLVVDSVGMEGAWELGRTEDGYELQLSDRITSFDVSKAFDKIPRDRIAALWQDPETGRLRLSLACACHAIAFEFRPGVVVIDIRSGPAPDGSSFEQTLATSKEPASLAAPTSAGTTDDAPPYSWIDLLRDSRGREAGRLTLPDLPTGDISLSPLEDALLSQISKGAAEGIVELAEGSVGEAGKISSDGGPWSRIAVGELPGLVVGNDRESGSNLTADGQKCLGDDFLNVSDWGSEGAVYPQIGLERSGMLTEFDQPVESAVLRAARFHIFLGFGVEAEGILELLGDQPTDQTAVLLAMAQIVDGTKVIQNPFDGMEVCDTSAALWAVLAADAGSALPRGTNAEAVARSFSALPSHLRKHLAGPLVELFLGANDQETARRLRDAALRTSTDTDPELSLLDARYRLAEGEEEQAQRLAEEVMSDYGPTSPEAAVTVVEAAFRGDQAINPALPEILEVFLKDASEDGTRLRLARAAALAHAMVGDFGSAFSIPNRDPTTIVDLWSLALKSADDDAFLQQAASHASTHPGTNQEISAAVARRLLDLGMADLALSWLGAITEASPKDSRLMAAEAHLMVRDGRSALSSVGTLEGPEAEELRARANLLLGEIHLAAEGLIRSGKADEASRAAAWTQDWEFVSVTGSEDWRDALSALGLDADQGSAGGVEAGPIAEGVALLEESAKARTAIEGLMEELAGDTPTQ